MNYILILSSLLLVYLYSIQIKNDFANPGFLYLLIWLVASCFSLVFLRGQDISFLSTFIIILGNFLFSYSIYFSNVLIKKQEKSFVDSSYVNKLIVFFVIFLCLFMYWYIFKDLQKISKLVEPSSNFNKVLEGARYVSTRSIARVSYLSATFNRVNYSIGLVFFYYYCKQIFYPNAKSVNSILLLIVSILCVSGSMLSTGRSELLGMVMGYVSIYLLFYSKKIAWDYPEYSLKLLRYLLRAGLGFIVLFMLIGVFVLNRTGGSQGETLLINLSKYIGSSIGAFDYYLSNTFQYPENSVFGQNIFLAFYSTLSSLGLYSGERIIFLPSTIIQGTITNVYTIYYYLIQDFGIIFGTLSQIFYGIFFGSIYYSIKKRFFNKYLIISYAIFSQAIVMSFFAEQLISVITNHFVRLFIAFAILIFIDLSNKIKIKV
ncbi:oligosaccharide repeat unit polymerase [Streptococcus suis]|uniref:O-antigen polymerase n=1 Tax=Streptococcus suis TaxID=1307 RepID=UPI001ABE4672|nr:O-antigen polymerase [Streptococcus suis]MBO4109232.1 oligosaccharide repeat unit polymerase [Streptococcus suis]